ncbi:hypothetical protein [Gottfriedia solisilvae]|uniref:Uncharacterized protein n=1 Tax=Gottfriedia solisilvae TaxID=1516104 RepID=A0A8J3AFG4_9BACI|nr:hypothetical protein [Gottfriedia solisilvae]GGI11546.1 hypothetical protein GCM10007380_08380 [Gottfriedia solisilvae]
MLLLKIFLSLGLFTDYATLINQEYSKVPNIKNLKTNYPKEGTWVKIPKGAKIVTLQVEAENTETVLFWIIPTGTQTWTERKLIGYDIKEGENDTNFSLTWKINKPYLHDHIYIQALGDGIANELINLSMN